MPQSPSANVDEQPQDWLIRELTADGRSQEAYDRIARIAQRTFQTGIVLIAFMHGEEIWLKSCLGTNTTDNIGELCAQTIAEGVTTVVPDARVDERFAASTVVTGAPYVRFYAGVPLLSPYGQVIGAICIADRTQRQLSQEERDTLEDLAATVMSQVKLDCGLTYLDAITHMPNRVRFSDDLRDRLDNQQADPGWVVTVEVMGLHEANEAVRALGLPYFYDHLFHAADIIRACLDSAVVYHMGPTHLAFFLASDADPFVLLGDLENRLRVSFVTSAGIPAQLDPGCGVRRLSDRSILPSEIIRTLFRASSEARENDSAIAVYDPAVDAAHQRSFLLLAEFPKALDDGELYLVYQPRIEARTGKCLAAEALLRWRHPIHGVIPPSDFLPLIAKTGLMRNTTQWVIGNVVRQLVEWQSRHIPIRCSLNISAVNLAERDFADRIAEQTAEMGLDPTKLEVELIEDVSLLRDGASLEQLKRIHELGVTIAIDDFGSGYSNLAYLLELPATVLKLDRSIVAGILHKETYATAVASIIKMAHRLGYSIVAEGVETIDIRDRLQAWQCDELQGYLFSRPLEADQFEAWYRQHSVEID